MLTRFTSAELSELVELSEAHAYASLARPHADFAKSAGGPHSFTVGSAVGVVAAAAPSSLNLNRVIGLGVREPCDEAMLDSIAETYRTAAVAYAIEMSPLARPAELPQWLRQRRLRRLLPTRMYWRSTADLPTHDSGLSVRTAAEVEEVEWLARLCCQVFRMPAATEAILAATQRDCRWTAWLVRQGQVAIGGGLCFVDEGIAWLGWDATLPEHRGRGAHRDLIVARALAARQRGCRYITAETATHTPARPDPSARNYEKLGFLLAYERHTYASIPARTRELAPAAHASSH